MIAYTLPIARLCLVIVFLYSGVDKLWHWRSSIEEIRSDGLPWPAAFAAATNRLGLGDKIRLIPGHCDPTVNLYDWYVCVRGNRVEQLWPITARGAVY